MGFNSGFKGLKAWSGRHFSNKWVRNSRKNTDSKGIKLKLKAT